MSRVQNNIKRLNLVFMRIGICLLLPSYQVAAEEVIPLGVEDGNIQVNKVVKTTPMGGTVTEYTKTTVNDSVEDDEQKPAVSEQGNVQEEKKTLANAESAQALLDNTEITFKHPEIMPKDGLIVKAENGAYKEEQLRKQLEKTKALRAKEQKKNDLTLVPGEEYVKAEKVVDAKQSTRKKATKYQSENAIIDRLEFNRANILDVTRALADISGLNFVATEEAAKKNVTVFLQNISVKNALEAITKNSGLWYRKDKDSGTYRIMSTDEYQRDLVVYREDITRVFNLLHPNPVIVATAVSDLYGDRVILSYGSDYDDFDTGEFNGGASNGSGKAGLSKGQSNLRRTVTTGSSRRNQSTLNNNKKNNNKMTKESVTGTSLNGAITEKFTADQLAKIEEEVEIDENGNVITSNAIRGISRAQQPIYITLSRRQNMMIVRSSDSVAIEEIERLVKSMDKPTKQVLLEMKILEVDVGDAYNQLFSFSAFSKNRKHRTFGMKNDEFSNTGKFIYQYVDDLIGVQLELLESKNKAKIVSSPLLLASNNRTARLFVGEERLLIRGATLTDPVLNQNGFVSTPAKLTYETEIRNVGNTLNITPKINADDTVTLGIFQDASSVNEDAVDFPPLVANGVVVNISLDTVQTSNVEGVVVAKDGLTVAIGGLISTSVSKREDKVPVLGDLPFIGNAFKDKVESSSRKEMVLLITPHIITNPSETDDVSRDAVEPLTNQEW